jgi:hypothetical protein
MSVEARHNGVAQRFDVLLASITEFMFTFRALRADYPPVLVWALSVLPDSFTPQVTWV